MKSLPLSDNDIRFFVKRSIARNILKGMSIEEAFKSVDIVFEYFKYTISDLDFISVQKDEEAKLNEAMKQISDDQIDKFMGSKQYQPTPKRATKNELNKTRKIGSISSYVFLVMNLVPFECEIYIIYDGTGDGELLGTIKPSPIDDGSLIFSDADRDPLFHIRPKAAPPTILHCHGETRVIAFMKDVAANFIWLVQHRECGIAALKVKDVPQLIEGCHVYTAHPLTAYITYHKPEKKKVSTFSVDKIAKNIAQAIVAVENDQSCALFVKDPINGNEYTLNITGFDDDGHLLANVVKIIK